MNKLKAKYGIFPLGLGSMPLSISNRPSKSDSISIINEFINNGGNFIDTADVYGLDDRDRGHNEKLICEALRQHNRDKILVATKGGATRPNGGWGLRGGHPRELRQACEQSLKNLNITSHSLYYLHGPDPDIPLADSIGELINLKNEGKIINIAIANVTLAELKYVTQLTEITAVQNRCNPFCKGDFNNGVIDYCKVKNILYIPYCPLGGWAEHKNLATNKLYNELTKKYQTSSYVISLAWLISKGDYIIPIPGIDKREQIHVNFSSIRLRLCKEDIEKIDNFPDLYSPKHLEV